VTDPAPLPGPPAHLARPLAEYGYLAAGVLVCPDNGGIPVPGQTVLVAAAVHAGTGRLDFAGVPAVAVGAAVVGDSLGYLLGRAFVHRWGRYQLPTPARLERAEDFFERYGGAVARGAASATRPGPTSGRSTAPSRSQVIILAVVAVLVVGLVIRQFLRRR
jgi:membrane protein DedA with SNARE-associated domain